ncbi:hypothetical protein SDC9_178242 [bioreactor metagenome]|uniref:Uncharacterized protein n=1 Tax=bioreactor metagenome TaxID=1076179 RepID=A0A645GV89_9ZZZZ
MLIAADMQDVVVADCICRRQHVQFTRREVGVVGFFRCRAGLDILHAQVDAVRTCFFDDFPCQQRHVLGDFVRRISESARVRLKETGEFFGILIPRFEGDPDIVRWRKDIIEGCDFAIEGFLDLFDRLDLLRYPRVVRPRSLDVVQIIRMFDRFFQ